MKDTYDLIIVGGGPAGLTTAIYARRANLNVLIIDDSSTNKLSKIANIENYPGFDSISGFELDQNFKKQVKNLNVEIVDERAINIKDHKVFTNNNEYNAKAILIATGSKQRKLNLPYSQEFEGKGISYCATCDGFFFRNKEVVVIGNNYQALEESLYLANIVSKLTIINRNDNFNADESLIKQVQDNEKINIIYNATPTSLNIDGNKIVGITINNINTNAKEIVDCVGVFPYISFNPSTDFVSKEILNDDGFIKVNADMSTTIDGLYAAGDCIQKDLRQVVTACADGAIAATSIIKYLKNKA